jgi:hypothetical protein
MGQNLQRHRSRSWLVAAAGGWHLPSHSTLSFSRPD